MLEDVQWMQNSISKKLIQSCFLFSNSGSRFLLDVLSQPIKFVTKHKGSLPLSLELLSQEVISLMSEFTNLFFQCLSKEADNIPQVVKAVLKGVSNCLNNAPHSLNFVRFFLFECYFFQALQNPHAYSLKKGPFSEQQKTAVVLAFTPILRMIVQDKIFSLKDKASALNSVIKKNIDKAHAFCIAAVN